VELPAIQYEVLQTLSIRQRPVGVLELVAELRRDQSQVMAACTLLEAAGYISLRQRPYQELRLGPQGQEFASRPLPERLIVDVLIKAGGRCPITEIPARCTLTAEQVGQSLRYLAQRGWARKEKDMLVLLLDPAQLEQQLAPQPDEQLLRALADRGAAWRDELEAQGLPVEAALALLSGRRGFVIVKERTERTAALTDAGRQLIAAGITARRQVTQLTPELLADGSWRRVELQPYDVRLAARKVWPGKDHPFQRTLDRVRRVFLEMGFEEITSPWVESSFWDFDALFQPQDHPARDLQDTFYVKRPDRCRLPDDELVERVRRTHEDGGDTGSTGWQYRWNRELAARPVLRTHTTAATIRALARHAGLAVGDGGRSAEGSFLVELVPGQTSGGARPGKYFAVGPVFRRETADFKHLPVFHQVDGIIVDPHASLCTLIGTLKAFYAKMGFPKVKVTPSFFPYTEPSAEVHLYMESRGQWVEMGGSGLFRPEVTGPLGIKDRVLAWGLGLERLAMMIHNLENIGQLYFPTMPWLRETPLCRS